MTNPEFSEEGRTMTDLQAPKTLREKVADGTAERQDFIDAGLTVHQSIFGLDAMTGGIRALGSAVALFEAVKPGWHWSLYDTNGLGKPEAQVEPPEYSSDPISAVADDPARALLLATIAALIEEGEG